MENRWSKRSTVSARIRFHPSAQDPMPATLRNLGIEGGFVEIDDSLPVGARDATVELELNTDSGPETFLLASRIVHHSRTGVGVMFRDLEPRVVRALMNAVEGPSGHIAA